MDVDFDVYQVLSLRSDDVDILTNAGGVATADALNGIGLSQREHSTNQIVVIHHTGCSAIPYTECYQKVQLARRDDGLPDFTLPEAISYTVHATIEAIVACASISYRDTVVGFVFDDTSRRLRRTN
jgi:carbonic anhydrase